MASPLFAIAVFIAVLAPLGALADSDVSSRLAAIERLEGSSQAVSGLALCPADVFAGHAANSKAEPHVACSEDLGRCLSSCLDQANGASCFEVARWFQTNGSHSDNRYAEMAFSLGCSAGHAGSCTNRGAGLQLGAFAEGVGDSAQRSQCMVRTFERTCESGDSWGCTMLGVAYHFGDGVVANTSEARRWYERSCEIAPSFDACGYARGGIEKLDDQ